MAGRGAPKAIVPSGARRCRSCQRARMARSPALVAKDSFAATRCPTRTGARPRPRPDAAIVGGEVSFEPPSRFTSLNHLVGEQLDRIGYLDAECSRGLHANLVDCKTSRSAGLAPLRIWP